MIIEIYDSDDNLLSTGEEILGNILIQMYD